MRILGKFIAIDEQIEREESAGNFTTILVDGLPELIYETDVDVYGRIGYHSFTSFLDATQQRITFFTEKNDHTSDECRDLMARMEMLESSCSCKVDSATAGPYLNVKAGGESGWWMAGGDKGYTWLYGHSPVVSFDLQGELIAVWFDVRAQAGAKLGLFQLPAQAA